MKKAQSSLEFLIIIAIGFTMVLIMGGLFFSFFTESKKILDKDQIERVGNDLIKVVDEIYFRGAGNKVQFKASFPNNIVNMTLHHSTNGTDPFDYLNFSYYRTINNEIKLGSSLFVSSDLYIRFNCTYSCNRINENLSTFDLSVFEGGPKTIEVQSQGDYVSIDFLR